MLKTQLHNEESLPGLSRGGIFVPVSVPVLDLGCEILISPQNKIHKSTALSMGENGISVGKHE